MGCPVPKITKCEAGAKWLLDPNKIYEMVAAVVDAVEKPVTVKMRIGWDEEHIFAVENAKLLNVLVDKLLLFMGVHVCKCMKEKQIGILLKQVKQAVNIPVIGNGDVETPQDAKRMLDETGVDGVMIGRAALGDPWMIYRTVKYLETGELMPEPTVREKIDVCILHFDRLNRFKE